VVARRVALKLMDVDAFANSDAVLREAQAMGRVNHPAVVRIYDAGVTARHVYVAMELVEGRTLRAVIVESSLSATRWFGLFAGIAEGLAAAHDAGVVHRDFKPENVLVTLDGNAQVTDFGLARVNALTGPWTAGAEAGGTPAYMAPEQLAGGTADARSDQYSFAVTLYEALKGNRPIVASSVQALSSAMKSPVIDWTQLSSRIRLILERALAHEPPARYPSMHELARELRRLSAPRRWPWVLAAAASAGVGMSVVLAVQQSPTAPDPCEAAGADVSAAWTSGQGARLEEMFARTNLPYAVRVGGTARRSLDEYAATLHTGYTAACRATHVQNTQSTEMLDRRIQCLDRGTAALAATGSLLASADSKTVSKTTTALEALVDVRSCADIATLTDEVAVPLDPELRRHVVAIRRQLAAADTAMVTAKYDDGIGLAGAAATAAKAIGYRPLEAEALFSLGSLHYAIRESARARSELESASLAAVAGRSRFVEARIRERMSQLLGLTLREPAEARRQIDLGFALLESMQGAESIKVQLFTTQAAILSIDGDHEGALAIHQRTLALVPENNRSGRAELSQLIGDELVELGRASEGLPLLEQNASWARELFGEDHPAFADALESLAKAYQESDQEKALDLMKRAYAIKVRVLPAESTEVTTYEANLGGMLVELDRVDEALPFMQRALDRQQRTMASDHPAHAMTLITMGKALGKKHRLAEALAITEQAEGILVARFGNAHPMVAIAQAQRGTLLGGLHREREAEPVLEAALAMHVAQGMFPDEIAGVRFELAKVLWARGTQNRTRVLALLGEAEIALRDSGKGTIAAAIVAWRGAHGL